MKKSIFLIFIAVFSLCSCSTEVASEPEPTGSDIKVVLLEELSSEGSRLKIRSETVEQQPCINFSLITDYNYTKENLRIKYSGIDMGSICATAIGPATSEESFSFVNGTYEVEFVNNGISNIGELIVDDEKYSMKLYSPVNVFLERETHHKIPENSYWGIIGYHEESSAALVQEFRDKLKAENAIFKEYPDGDYGYFEISNGQMQLPELHGYWFAEPVIFQFEGNIKELNEVIGKFSSEHRDEISIGVNSFRGEHIHSYNL